MSGWIIVYREEKIGVVSLGVWDDLSASAWYSFPAGGEKAIAQL
ncbi:hypothetical protein [Microseira sp. BLCC-F43]